MLFRSLAKLQGAIERTLHWAEIEQFKRDSDTRQHAIRESQQKAYELSLRLDAERAKNASQHSSSA